jgi:uncharacterized protein YyaL (SSP411 family)
MFEARAKRPRPHLDDKVLVSWNGLMIAALARAARTLDMHVGDEAAARSLASAVRAASFIRTRLWDPTSGQLLRRYRKGDAAVLAYADDYAALTWGALELFQATGRGEWLDWAVALQAMADGVVDVKPFITHEFPLRKCSEAFMMMKEKTEFYIKVMFVNK